MMGELFSLLQRPSTVRGAAPKRKKGTFPNLIEEKEGRKHKYGWFVYVIVEIECISFFTKVEIVSLV